LGPELPATVPAPKLDDVVWVGVLIPVETTGDVLAVGAFPVVVIAVAIGSDEIEVGMAMETAVTFPKVRSEVGMVASGDAVTGSLKRSHISAIA
jgi:hypothetical protein